MSRRIEMVGKTFGELIVIKRGQNTGTGRTRWICRCVCGKECLVESYSLRVGHTVSCGHPVTHCKYGHEFTEENTRIVPRYDDREGTKRMCLICNAIKQREVQLRRIGWTTFLLKETTEAQHGLCAICEGVLTFDSTVSDRICADHAHAEPPRPRGVLCTTCNVMLGMAQDNPDILRAGAEYLEKFSLEIPAEETKHLIVST